MNALHKTVLLEEALELLELKEGMTVVDCTFGEGGHTKKIAEKIGEQGKVFTFDVDPQAIEKANEAKKTFFQIHPIRSNFKNLKAALAAEGVDKIDGLMADIGLSQGLLEVSGRGFSFQKEEMLDMRMDPAEKMTAADVLNGYSEEEIADILFHLGEERKSRRIAKAICSLRKKRKIETTTDLINCVQSALSYKKQRFRIHPATKTFQALRIFVNDELESLRKLIQDGIEILNENARFVIISFHSLEDRIVKHEFIKQKRAGIVEVLTKKPLVPSPQEIEENKKSRSAKLRALKKK